jgi:hypothetical protein
VLLADQLVRDDLHDQLLARGFTVTGAAADADFLVAFQVTGDDRGRAATWPFVDELGGARPADDLPARSLLVYFVDPATQKVYWRARATGLPKRNDSPDPERIFGAVKRALRDAPSGSGCAPRHKT